MHSVTYGHSYDAVVTTVTVRVLGAPTSLRLTLLAVTYSDIQLYNFEGNIYLLRYNDEDH